MPPFPSNGNDLHPRLQPFYFFLAPGLTPRKTHAPNVQNQPFFYRKTALSHSPCPKSPTSNLQPTSNPRLPTSNSPSFHPHLKSRSTPPYVQLAFSYTRVILYACKTITPHVYYLSIMYLMIYPIWDRLSGTHKR